MDGVELEWELAARVADGALFMDGLDPDWYWYVNPDTLDMAEGGWSGRSWCGCVLAQHSATTFSLYLYGLDTGEAQLLGFTFGSSLRDPVWDVLTDLWREEILDRRAEWFDKREAA